METFYKVEGVDGVDEINNSLHFVTVGIFNHPGLVALQKSYEAEGKPLVFRGCLVGNFFEDLKFSNLRENQAGNGKDWLTPAEAERLITNPPPPPLRKRELDPCGLEFLFLTRL